MKPRLRSAVILLLVGILLASIWMGITLAMRPASPGVTAITPLPTATASPSPSVTAWPTLTPTSTLTWTVTDTETQTVTPTNTLSTRVLIVTSVNPDVTLQPPVYTQQIPTSAPMPTQAIGVPETPLAPLPQDGESADLVGWYQREATDPAVQQIGIWQTYTLTTRASLRQYVYTDSEGARLVYRFVGAGVRLHYAAFYNYGLFDVIIDGEKLTSIDSYSPRTLNPHGDFLTTAVYSLTAGWHTLEIVRVGRKTADSGGTYVAIDAIDIYKSGTLPTTPPTQVPITVQPTSDPQPAQRIQLVAAPPTVRPTPTQAPPVITAIDFSVAYDLNNNKIFDQLEGVQGLSVRLVRADTNLVLATGYTNAAGFVHLEGTDNVPLRLVVPYLGKYWDVQNPSGTVKVQLIVPAVNLPGLIP